MSLKITKILFEAEVLDPRTRNGQRVFSTPAYTIEKTDFGYRIYHMQGVVETNLRASWIAEEVPDAAPVVSEETDMGLSTKKKRAKS